MKSNSDINPANLGDENGVGVVDDSVPLTVPPGRSLPPLPLVVVQVDQRVQKIGKQQSQPEELKENDKFDKGRKWDGQQVAEAMLPRVGNESEDDHQKSAQIILLHLPSPASSSSTVSGVGHPRLILIGGENEKDQPVATMIALTEDNKWISLPDLPIGT